MAEAKAPPAAVAPPSSTAEPALASTEAWEGLERTQEFKGLVAAKWRFVVPATIFFLVYYFLLPVLNGVASGFMKTKVIGNVNIAYLFALSQFIVAWILAAIYIRRANTVFDRLADAVRRRASRGRGEGVDKP